MFRLSTDTESRTIDLPDGRVLFYAAGRAFYLKDLAHARRLESRLKTILFLSPLAILGAILAAHWLGNWWLALAAVPPFLLAMNAEHIVVLGCDEATDPTARAEVTARELAKDVDVVSAVFWPALVALGPLMPALLRGKTSKSGFQVLEVAIVALGISLGAVQLLRQRRARRHQQIIGGPRNVDNRPIVPR